MMFSWLWAIPLWILFFVLLIGFLYFLVWLWTIVDCLKSGREPVEKLLWLIIILIFPVLGVLLYFVLGGKPMKHKHHYNGSKNILYRVHRNKMIGGVCGGLGKYFDIDPTVVRLIWILFVFLSFGTAILIYIIAWAIIPEE